MTKKAKQKGIELGVGLLLYVIAWIVTEYHEVGKTAETLLFLLPYIALAATTYIELFKSIKKLLFLDENLLMIIATLGAFAVGRNKEAVGAMLFYQV